MLRPNGHLIFLCITEEECLQGYFAGNPRTDDRFDVAGRIQFFYGMGMLSDELYEVIHRLK